MRDQGQDVAGLDCPDQGAGGNRIELVHRRRDALHDASHLLLALRVAGVHAHLRHHDLHFLAGTVV